MPKKVIIIFFLVVLFQTAFGQTITEIQQTNEPGTEGTYPSTYVGQQVTISNVTIGSKGFNGSENNMFAFDLNPGAWNGIYLNNTNNVANLRALVSITGTVAENNGMTELTNATITQINAGPLNVEANIVTLAQLQALGFAEQYESSLIEIKNLKYSGKDEGNYWLATDANANEIRVGIGFFNYDPEMNEFWDSIKGVLSYDGSNFVINPRNAQDLINPHPRNIEILSQFEKIGDKLYLHFNADRQILASYTDANTTDFGLNRFSIDINFDKAYVAYNGYRVDEMDDTPAFSIYPEIYEENITLNYFSDDVFSSAEAGATLTMIFDLKEYGNINFKVNSFYFQDNKTIEIYQKLTNKNLTYNNTYNERKAYLSIFNGNNDKNIFNPYLNERLTIKYGFKPGFSTKTIVRIYDLKGRLVYTPVNQVYSGLGQFIWDGRDKNRELVDIGTYICQVEVVVRETGDKYVTDQPIVVAGQLK